MSAFSDFHYSGGGGSVSGRALAELVENVAPASLKIWLQRFEGYVLAFGGVEVANTAAGAVVRVVGLIAVVDGRLVIEEEIECPLEMNETDVYLIAHTKAVPLDSEVPAGLQGRIVRGELTTDPGEAAAIRLVKCEWSRPEGGEGSRVEATPDRCYWPPVMRVADHPFSLASAKQLGDLLAQTAEGIFLVESAVRGEEIGWQTLLHLAFKTAEERFRDRPDRLAEIRRVARESEQSAVVSSLLRILRCDLSGDLPTSIEIEGKRARLVAVLHDAHPSQHFAQAGAEVRIDCGSVAEPGWLAIVVSGRSGSDYRLEAIVDGVKHTAHRYVGRGTETVTQIPKNSHVCISVKTGPIAPTRVGVGLYQIEDA